MRLFYMIPSLYAFLFLEALPPVPGMSSWMDYGLAGGLAVYMVFRYERLATRINRENALKDEAHEKERVAIASRAEKRETEFLAVIKANCELQGRMVDAVSNLVTAAARLAEMQVCPLSPEARRN